MLIVIRRFRLLWMWIYVHLVGWIFYDKRYLTGKWFEDGIRSLGWKWAYRDIHYRIHTLRHFSIPWPVSPDIGLGDNIEFDPDDLNNMNIMNP